MALPFPELSLVVFALNEEGCVREVLEEILGFLREHVADYQLVFVDDGSTDSTPEIVAEMAAEDPGLELYRHETNQGIGAALRTGYGQCRKAWVTLLPADGQLAPTELLNLFCEAEGKDIVIANYPRRFETADNLQRKVLSRGLRLLTFLCTGVRTPIDGCYLIKREVLEATPLKSQSFFLNLELPIRVLRSGAPTALATMEVRPRMAGESKVLNTRRISLVAEELFRLRLNLWLGR